MLFFGHILAQIFQVCLQKQPGKHYGIFNNNIDSSFISQRHEK